MSLGGIEMLCLLIFLFLLYQSVLSKWPRGFKFTSVHKVPPLNVMSLEVKKISQGNFFPKEQISHSTLNYSNYLKLPINSNEPVNIWTTGWNHSDINTILIPFQVHSIYPPAIRWQVPCICP